jgi:hypothetical protein
MSFHHTKEQIRNRTKFETRRLGWADMKPGELFCAIEKGQGLKKGEKVTRIVVLECLGNHPEKLRTITRRSVKREGFPGMTPLEFVAMFCRHMGCEPETEVNVITFRYVRCACCDRGDEYNGIHQKAEQ